MQVQLTNDKGHVKLGRRFCNKPYIVTQVAPGIFRVIIVTDETKRLQAEHRADELVSKVQTELALQGAPLDDEKLAEFRKKSVRELLVSPPEVLWGG